MKKKLQAVLERVKDPETNVAISELGLVVGFVTIRSKRNSPFFSIKLDPVKSAALSFPVFS